MLDWHACGPAFSIHNFLDFMACLMPTICACRMMLSQLLSLLVSLLVYNAQIQREVELQLAGKSYEAEPNQCGQVWMSPHPPRRGSKAIGTCPMLHTGFHKAWTASGLPHPSHQLPPGPAPSHSARSSVACLMPQGMLGMHGDTAWAECRASCQQRGEQPGRMARIWLCPILRQLYRA